MREIRFRAWDVINKKMYPVAYPIWNGATEGKIDFVNHTVEMIDEDGDDKPILMQFTGLLDKNGNEIFEGDVLKLKVNQHIWVYQVGSIETDGTNLYAINIRDNVTIDDATNTYIYEMTGIRAGLPRPIPSGCEIVGNIHENPELLTK